jgi:hypothetical protein
MPSARTARKAVSPFRSSKSSFVLEGTPPKGLRRLMLSA